MEFFFQELTNILNIVPAPRHALYFRVVLKSFYILLKEKLKRLLYWSNRVARLFQHLIFDWTTCRRNLRRIILPVVIMAFFAKISHTITLKTLLKAVLCIATVSFAFLLINVYHIKSVHIFKRNVSTERQTNGVVADHVDNINAMECTDNMFMSPMGCLPCPNGTFSFPGWSECKPFLNCSEIAFQVHLKRKGFRGVTKHKWMAEWRGHEVVYMNCSSHGAMKRCLRGMTRMERFQGPFVTRLIGRCYDRLEVS